MKNKFWDQISIKIFLKSACTVHWTHMHWSHLNGMANKAYTAWLHRSWGMTSAKDLCANGFVEEQVNDCWAPLK